MAKVPLTFLHSLKSWNCWGSGECFEDGNFNYILRLACFEVINYLIWLSYDVKNAAEEVYPKVANYQAWLHAKAKAKVKFDGGGHWGGVVIYRDCYIYTIFLITGIHITNMKKTKRKEKRKVENEWLTWYYFLFREWGCLSISA